MIADPSTPDQVPAQVADLVNHSFPHLIKAVMQDEAQIVVCNALDSLGQTVALVRFAIVS